MPLTLASDNASGTWLDRHFADADYGSADVARVSSAARMMGAAHIENASQRP